MLLLLRCGVPIYYEIDRLIYCKGNANHRGLQELKKNFFN